MVEKVDFSKNNISDAGGLRKFIFTIPYFEIEYILIIHHRLYCCTVNLGPFVSVDLNLCSTIYIAVIGLTPT